MQFIKLMLNCYTTTWLTMLHHKGYVYYGTNRATKLRTKGTKSESN